jgi:aryl-phospho-beta-D-glucosidase BglC (GH1 family)
MENLTRMTIWARVAAFVLLLGSLGLADVSGQTVGQSLAFERAARLQRGINVDLWYAQTRDFSTERLDSFVTPADFPLIKSLGFDHVRLSIDPTWVTADAKTAQLKPEVLARIDRTVAQMNDAGLAVIIDVQPTDEWKVKIDKAVDEPTEFFDFWTAFASHFAATDPEKVFLEIMNEPITTDLYRWQGMQADVIARVRKAAPRHTIIATAAKFDGVASLLALEPVRDEDVIYTFHFYEPYWFTHQGASWGAPAWLPLHDLPYPSSPEAVLPVMDLPWDPNSLQLIAQYGRERWDAKKIGALIASVAAWGESRGVPVYCGEFGALKEHSQPADRARYLHDVRQAAEANHIGWAMWDYQDSFGVVTKTSAGTKPDPLVLRALGLKP